MNPLSLWYSTCCHYVHQDGQPISLTFYFFWYGNHMEKLKLSIHWNHLERQLDCCWLSTQSIVVDIDSFSRAGPNQDVPIPWLIGLCDKLVTMLGPLLLRMLYARSYSTWSTSRWRLAEHNKVDAKYQYHIVTWVRFFLCGLTWDRSARYIPIFTYQQIWIDKETEIRFASLFCARTVLNSFIRSPDWTIKSYSSYDSIYYW